MRAITLLLVLLLAAAPVVAQESPDSPVQAGITLLDTWIRTQMEFGGLPGLVIGIVHDQEPVWVKAYGHASLDPPVPMREDSIFRIASHSKLFTAIAVMRARDAGSSASTIRSPSTCPGLTSGTGIRRRGRSPSATC